jgi:CheY-like chemotaxis protein
MKYKILIVEDEIVTALSFIQSMEDWGYEFLEPATTGEEAVERAREQKPDLILMDINLPGRMNGIEAAKKIRALLDDIPVIFTSAYPEYQMKAKIEIGGGRMSYLTKPIDFKEVRAKIEEMLKEKT